MKFPYTDGWKLRPENAHSIAHALLTESFFWEVSDYNSPLGNDDGADAFRRYVKAHKSPDCSPDAVTFITEYFKYLDVSLIPWPMPSESDSVDIAVASAAHNIIIAVAFGMFIIHGCVCSRLKSLASEMIKRELSPICLSRCGFPEERIERLNICLTKIDLMPECPN